MQVIATFIDPKSNPSRPVGAVVAIGPDVQGNFAVYPMIGAMRRIKSAESFDTLADAIARAVALSNLE
jgi:hypothetical protein